MGLPTLRLLSLCARPAVQANTTRQVCRCLSATPAYRRHVGPRKEFSKPAGEEAAATGAGDRQLRRLQRVALAPQFKTGTARRAAADTGLHDYTSNDDDTRSASYGDSHGGKKAIADFYDEAEPEADSERTVEDDVLYRLPPKKPKQQSREVDSARKQPVYEDDSNVFDEDNDGEEEDEEREVTAGRRSAKEEEDQARRLRRHNSDFTKKNLMTSSSIEMPRTEEVNPGVSAALKENQNMSFNDLAIHPAVTESLSALGVKTPTNIQVKAIPQILEGKSLIVSAETGCGKTLAYLAPLISLAHREHADEGYIGELGRPSAIVLQPSLELVEQCYLVAMAMKSCDFRPMKLAKGVKSKAAKKRLVSGSVDILITTPDSLLNVLHQLPELLTLADVKTVVVDECDTLVDKNFEALLTNVHNKFKGIGKDKQQWIYTGATVPPEAIARIRAIRPDATEIVTDAVHKPLPNINYEFYKVPHMNRLDCVTDLLKQTRRNPGQTIIFCNTVQCCDWVTNALSKLHFNVTKLHSGCSFKERTQRYKLFNTGEVQILVCTDVVGRGLDTMRVSHVINIDFPVGMAEFLHRSGRVGRVGTDLKGRCTSYVCKNRDQRTANIIKACIHENKPLPNIELW